MNDRFVLLLDILGFKRMVETDPLETVCTRIENVLLRECEQWAPGAPRADFDTIHFSDTVLVFTREAGSHAEWFNDLVYIGSRICVSLLAEKIPVRGALAYGSFLTKTSGRHQIFVGKALVEAHEQEQRGQYLGFAIAPEVWRAQYPASTAANGLRESGIGIEQPDGSLLVNILTQFRGHRKKELISELESRWSRRDVQDLAWLDTELLALGFVSDRAKQGAEAGVPDCVAIKYQKTAEFLRDALGDQLYAFAESLVEEVRATRAKGAG